jgi:hypothetical protein
MKPKFPRTIQLGQIKTVNRVSCTENEKKSLSNHMRKILIDKNQN